MPQALIPLFVINFWSCENSFPNISTLGLLELAFQYWSQRKWKVSRHGKWKVSRHEYAPGIQTSLSYTNLELGQVAFLILALKWLPVDAESAFIVMQNWCFPVQQKSVTVTPSGTAKKCHCKRMAYTVSLKATEFYYNIGNWEIR